LDNLAAFLAANPGWSWLIVGAALFVLDVMAPGLFLVWFGAGAAVVGAILFAVQLGFAWQILLFCGVSVLLVLLGRRFWSGTRGGVSDKPLLNKRARQMIGRNFALATPIQSGRGRITAGDSLWTVKGPDMPAGSAVHVIGAEGTVLIVEPAQSSTMGGQG
jgi:membrane protein implicated in regulation of membrane protease activity